MSFSVPCTSRLRIRPRQKPTQGAEESDRQEKFRRAPRIERLVGRHRVAQAIDRRAGYARQKHLQRDVEEQQANRHRDPDRIRPKEGEDPQKAFRPEFSLFRGRGVHRETSSLWLLPGKRHNLSNGRLRIPLLAPQPSGRGARILPHRAGKMKRVWHSRKTRRFRRA